MGLMVTLRMARRTILPGTYVWFNQGFFVRAQKHHMHVESTSGRGTNKYNEKLLILVTAIFHVAWLRYIPRREKGKP